MSYWINGIGQGVLVDSRNCPQTHVAVRSLRHLFFVWTVRDQDGAILESWWISAEEYGPAIRAEP